MAHYCILSLTTDSNSWCPLNEFDDYSSIGADYGGERRDEDAKRVIEYMFGGLFKFNLIYEECEEEDSTFLGEIVCEDPGNIEYNACKAWESFRDEISGVDYEDFGKKTSVGDLFREWDRLWDKDIIYMNSEYMTPLQFLVTYAKDIASGMKLYVNGVIDFHS